MSARSALFGALLLLAGALLVACGGEGNDPTAGKTQSAQICADGDRRVCSCGGSGGMQACKPSGEGFERCVCDGDSPDGGTSGNLPPSDGCGTCDGCCNGSTCVPFGTQNDTSCGKRGMACRACNNGGVCDSDNGTCVQPTAGVCNRATCPSGCCSATGCITDTSWSQCGAGGVSCGSCALGGTACESDGTCKNNYLAAEEYFYLSVRQINVEPKTPNGWDWDNLVLSHTAPDPMVCLSYTDTDSSGNAVQRSACTKHCSDTASCSLSASDGLLKYCYELSTCFLCSSPKTVCDPILFRGSALKQGTVDALIYDYDPGNANDLIGATTLPQTRTLTGNRFTTGAFPGVLQIEYEILYALP